VTQEDLWGGPFSAAQLERCILFDPRRGMRGQTGEDAIASLLETAEEWQKRGRRPIDAVSLRSTAGSFLANLIVAAKNRVDTQRFVALSFRRADYAGTPLSTEALAVLRDQWLAKGLVEGRPGYRRAATTAQPCGHARRTRLRATARLLDRLTEAGVERRNVGWIGPADAIVVRLAGDDLPAEPEDVAASRSVLQRVSNRIADADVTLPDDAWSRVVKRYATEKTLDPAAADERVNCGDVTATTLYRVFKRNWQSGGRLYGGWWINLPKGERLNLTIRSEPVVEIDYAQLHPTILFARVGRKLDFDPYVAPGLEGEALRALGKRTFNRLINKTSAASGMRPRLSASAEDLAALPPGLTFQQYLERFVERLAPVAGFFGSAEGLRLQREDSDLAIGVLERLEAAGIPVLPVHDSFITPRRFDADLRAAMIASFVGKYGFEPALRLSRQTLPRRP
jgi:hypothetical protein